MSNSKIQSKRMVTFFYKKRKENRQITWASK